MTTCIVAYKLNRHYLAVELNPDYIKIGNKRLEKLKNNFGLFEGKQYDKIIQERKRNVTDSL